ncbi:MAG: hypothetical protein ACN2B6_12230 [Rickettsiales bacterium]
MNKLTRDEAINEVGIEAVAAVEGINCEVYGYSVCGNFVEFRATHELDDDWLTISYSVARGIYESEDFELDNVCWEDAVDWYDIH